MARLGSRRPREESYLQRAGRAQEDSQGPKPTAGALSPSSPARRRKWAAGRPRPRPAPRPRPPPRGPGAARPSQHLPLARCSLRLPPLPPLSLALGASPQPRELGDRQAGTPKRTSCSPPFTPELLHSWPLVGVQAGSDPPREEGGAVITGTAREPVMAGESPLSAQVSLGERPAQFPPPAAVLRTLARPSELCYRCSPSHRLPKK